MVAAMPLVRPALTAADAAAWAQWLALNAATSSGVWLTLAKKDVTKPTSLTYAQALDAAFCHGWIDGQRHKQDDTTYAQSFTPRTTKSAWSKRNVEHIARLEDEGRMTPAGRAAVEAAKADGRWEAVYAGSATAVLPPDFMGAVAAVPKAQATMNQLSKSDRYAIYHQLQNLKTESGQQKRIERFVQKLALGETRHSQKSRKVNDTGLSTTRPRKPRKAARVR